jgi:uncharacterized RmlC-like cupin family protein
LAAALAINASGALSIKATVLLTPKAVNAATKANVSYCTTGRQPQHGARSSRAQAATWPELTSPRMGELPASRSLTRCIWRRSRRRFTMATDPARWRNDGIRIVRHDQLDSNTPQTPGMQRAAAITAASAGAHKIWAGTVAIHPDARTGAHHHGALESVIYVVSGKARLRWGERLEYAAEAEPGDFIFVPPYVPHQEINASREQSLMCVVVRSDQEPVVVNLAIEGVEAPEEVTWVDPHHPQR